MDGLLGRWWVVLGHSAMTEKFEPTLSRIVKWNYDTLPTQPLPNLVWNPHLKRHGEKIEKLRRASTTWVPSLRDLGYEGRLKKLQVPPLTEGRGTGDMIISVLKE